LQQPPSATNDSEDLAWTAQGSDGRDASLRFCPCPPLPRPRLEVSYSRLSSALILELWDELLSSRQVRLNLIILASILSEVGAAKVYKAAVRGKPDHGNSRRNYFEGNRSSFTLQRIGTLASRDRSAIPAHRCRVAGRRSRPGRSPQAGGCDLRLAPVAP